MQPGQRQPAPWRSLFGGFVDTRRKGTTILDSMAEPDLMEACDIIQRMVGRPLASNALRTRLLPTPAPATD